MRFSSCTVLSVIAGSIAAQALPVLNSRAEPIEALDEMYKRAVAEAISEQLAARDYSLIDDLLYVRQNGRKRSSSTRETAPPKYPETRRNSAPANPNEKPPAYSSNGNTAAGSRRGSGSSEANRVADGFRPREIDFDDLVQRELDDILYERQNGRKRSSSTRETAPPKYPETRRNSAPANPNEKPPAYSSNGNTAAGSRRGSGSSEANRVADGFRPRDALDVDEHLFERQNGRKRSSSTRETAPPKYPETRRNSAPANPNEKPPAYSSNGNTAAGSRRGSGSSEANRVADGFRPRDFDDVLFERQNGRKRSSSTRETAPPKYPETRRNSAPANPNEKPPAYSSNGNTAAESSRRGSGSSEANRVADGFRPRDVDFDDLVQRELDDILYERQNGRKRSSSTRETAPPKYPETRRNSAPANPNEKPPAYSSNGNTAASSRRGSGSSEANRVADGFRPREMEIDELD